MVDKEIVYRYLEELEESLIRIENMDFTFDMILGDEDIQDLLDRRMQKAIEAAMDICAHLVASEKLGSAKSAHELFLLLAKAKILDQKLAQKMCRAVGFRNLLVHQYSDVDYRLAYVDLKEKLKDLRAFAGEISKFIKKGSE